MSFLINLCAFYERHFEAAGLRGPRHFLPVPGTSRSRQDSLNGDFHFSRPETVPAIRKMLLDSVTIRLMRSKWSKREQYLQSVIWQIFLFPRFPVLIAHTSSDIHTLQIFRPDSPLPGRTYPLKCIKNLSFLTKSNTFSVFDKKASFALLTKAMKLAHIKPIERWLFEWVVCT